MYFVSINIHESALTHVANFWTVLASVVVHLCVVQLLWASNGQIATVEESHSSQWGKKIGWTIPKSQSVCAVYSTSSLPASYEAGIFLFELKVCSISSWRWTQTAWTVIFIETPKSGFQHQPTATKTPSISPRQRWAYCPSIFAFHCDCDSLYLFGGLGKHVEVGKLGCKRLSRNYIIFGFYSKISTPTSRLEKLIPYFHTDVSEIIPFMCGNPVFLLRFPTNIGCKLTDTTRVLNLMLVWKQIAAWRVVFGFSCCPSRGCASQEWRKRLGHPELLTSLSVTGPLNRGSMEL